MLSRKTAVITGCLQGIGQSVMEVFARNGADIFACSYRQTDEFEAHIAALRAECGVSIVPVYFDFSDEASMKAAVKTIQSAKQPIDALVNVAGINRDAYFPMMSRQELQTTFDVNFFSQMAFTQYIVRLMQRNPAAQKSIVFTSSISALDGNEGQCAYAASKGALISAMKTLSRELGPKGIRVNAVAPGVIKTPMTDALTAEQLSHTLRNSELGRVGLPEEVANVILFLSSERAAYMTGQVIRVDGGIG